MPFSSSPPFSDRVATRPSAAAGGASRARCVLALLLATGVLAGCAVRAPRSRHAGDTALALDGIPLREFGQETCGAGSLSAVFTYHGDPVSVEELDARLPRADGGGVLSIDLLIAARERGYDARWVPGNERRIEEQILVGRPVILMLRVLDAPGERLDYHHYVVVDGFDAERRLLRFHFGDGKTRWSPLGRALRRSWRGTDRALMVIRPEAGALLRRAAALEAENRLPEAEHELRAILRSEPGATRAWTNLGNVLRLQGRVMEAENAYRRALETDPYDAATLNNLAWLLYERGELAEAESLALKAVSDRVDDLDLVFDTLGRILLAEGRCASAAATFRRGLDWSPTERSPVRAMLLHGLARAHVACGDSTGAIAMLEEALRCSPDSGIAGEIRMSLASLEVQGAAPRD